MRRLIFILLVALSVSCYGQKGFYGGFSANFGAKGMVNQNLYGLKFLYLNGADKTFDLDHKFTVGYGANAKLGYNFIPPLGIQWEIGYQTRGQNYEDTDGKSITHKKNIDLKYINTGIYFRYTSIFRKNYYKREQKIRLAVTVGPQFNILLSGNVDYSLFGEGIDALGLDFENIDYPNSNLPLWESNYEFTTEDDDKDLFRNFDIGILGRVGVDIYPKKWFFISPTLTSYLSLTDINNDNFTKHSGYGQSRNFYLGFELGVSFYINEKVYKPQ